MARSKKKSLEKQLAAELGMDPNNLSQDDKDKIEVFRDIVFEWLEYMSQSHLGMSGGWKERAEQLYGYEQKGEL